MNNYWLTETATDLDPALVARRPCLATVHIYYHGRTGQPLGMIRRIPRGGFPRKPHICGNFSTAWFTCGQIETKCHWYLDAAKKFLERKFTRTVVGRVPSHGVCSVQSSRFNGSTVQRSRPVQDFQSSTLDRLAA